MKYTVEQGHPAVDNVIYHAGLTKKQAVALAQKLAKGPKQIYVSWHRASDDQPGYLNRDGNHAITGTAW